MSSKTLTKHCKTEEDKRQFDLDWSAGYAARKRLHQILDEKIQTIQRLRLSKDHYLHPNYAIKQAALNEQERCYSELKELLDINS